MRIGQVALVLLLVAAGLLEWWACAGGQCISEGVWAWGAVNPWLTIGIVVVGLGALLVHFVWPILVRRRRSRAGHRAESIDVVDSTRK